VTGSFEGGEEVNDFLIGSHSTVHVKGDYEASVFNVLQCVGHDASVFCVANRAEVGFISLQDEFGAVIVQRSADGDVLIGE
jgi:hypothetical protein